MSKKRVFARLMARELTDDDLALAAGGMAAGPGGPSPKGPTALQTACMGGNGRYVVDDNSPD